MSKIPRAFQTTLGTLAARDPRSWISMPEEHAVGMMFAINPSATKIPQYEPNGLNERKPLEIRAP
jgi:hypothetical protein